MNEISLALALESLLPGSILYIGGMVAFFLRTHFSKKGILFACNSPKLMPFLTISTENIFFRTQGTRLGAIVASNKGLEYALVLEKENLANVTRKMLVVDSMLSIALLLTRKYINNV